MSSGRTLLSRPRTRIYDANYNIGENYYRSAIDHLDKKYSPRPASPLKSSVAKDILARHENAFAEEDLSTSRRRAEKAISETNVFDVRRSRATQRALDLVQNEIDEETASALKRIRANKRVSTVEDVDFDSAVDNLNNSRLISRSDKVLRSVGINEASRKALDEDIKRRSLKVTSEAAETENFVKWSPVLVSEETAAVRRAKQTRDRLLNLEDEMAAVAERQVVRERRAAKLKAIVAESTEETQAAQTAIQAVSSRSRRSRNVEE